MSDTIKAWEEEQERQERIKRDYYLERATEELLEALKNKVYPSSDGIYDDIKEERRRQYVKWGIQEHNALYWLGILTEELGELAKALIEYKPSGEARRELVQIAAVAVAVIEQIDREGKE